MKLNRKIKNIEKAPERIIQFGEGNFLRAFVDWMVDEMNRKAGFNSSVVLVQPINFGMVDKLNEQDGLYTLVSKGIKNGKALKESQVIGSVSRGLNPYTQYDEYLKLAENPDMRFIVSNTTEAGITFDANDKLNDQPASSFPAKLTALLYHRFITFNGDASKGFIILPCELIDRNGDKLQKCVRQYCDLWSLDREFINWLDTANVFTNTLVDRIVPGFSPESAKEVKEKEGYEDNMVVDGEQFHLWVIEGPQWIKNEIPAEAAGLNVLFVDDVTPYRTRKVRLLNGPHTVMTPVAYLCGIEYVGDALEDELMGQFIQQTINNDIIPALDMPKEELEKFAAEVLDRFRNPFVKHALMSISLNSISKFKARVLDTIKEYNAKYNELPNNLVLSLAALMAFYKGEFNGKAITLKDTDYVLSFFNTNWKKLENKEMNLDAFVQVFLSNQMIWGEDLTKIEGLCERTAFYLDKIIHEGMEEVVKSVISIEA
ncbi:tagaturonate reductase [Saccharicrinis sp. FJH54]|uniref:tagaturonate reductase n=1 Tax=Saccharicrinis sp. FJH54 TaxID=3344665 RepID=UPI0035D52279